MTLARKSVYTLKGVDDCRKLLKEWGLDASSLPVSEGDDGDAYDVDDQ